MKPGQRGRGFNSYRQHRDSKPTNTKYSASCLSCIFNDEEDGCTNNNVTPYDVVQDGDRKYCVYWKGLQSETSRKNKNREDW